MRLAIFHSESGVDPAIAELERQQALAICARLGELGQEVALVCERGSALAKAAGAAGLPFLETGRKSGPLALFKLWRWQRRIDKLAILAIGQQSMACAKRILAMRKPENTEAHLYFPHALPAGLAGKALARASNCFYGADHIGMEIERILAQGNADLPRPELVKLAPGIVLTDYANRKGGEPRQRFVFGMAGSLLPESGALLAVRAMSALWQHKDIPAWELRMFGSGPRFEEVMTEAENLGVLPRLSLLSDQPLAEVARHCDAWLAPGLADAEMPEVFWAGIAAGLPVIASASALHEQRVPDSGAILKINGHNPQELATAMLALMRDKKLRAQMAKAAGAARERTGVAAMAASICARLLATMPEKAISSKAQ